jgi:biotin carboxyl carrier protein
VEKVTPGIISLGPHQYSAKIGQRPYIVTVLDDRTIQVDEKPYVFSIRKTSQGVYSLILDGSVYEVVPLAGNRNGEASPAEIVVNGVPVEVVVDDHRSLLRKGMLQNRSHVAVTQAIRAPMPGKVIRVEVKVSDRVNPGTGLIILEAMKMENEIKSVGTGVVEEVRVETGKAVEKGELLISIHSE